MAVGPIGGNPVLGAAIQGAPGLMAGAEGGAAGGARTCGLAGELVRAAEFVVLDEPTAALDLQAEAEVYPHFGEMARGKVSVLISHRLGAARIADRNLVLKGGDSSSRERTRH